MKANVKLLAERAQSAAFRNPVRTAPKPMPPKPVYTPPPAPVIPDIDWDNLSDPEVLSDAYLSGLTNSRNVAEIRPIRKLASRKTAEHGLDFLMGNARGSASGLRKWLCPLTPQGSSSLDPFARLNW